MLCWRWCRFVFESVGVGVMVIVFFLVFLYVVVEIVKISRVIVK